MAERDLRVEIEELRAQVAVLHRQATTDGLTGLLNHRAFYERLTVECRRAGRYAHPLALVVLDLDGFKALNDACGHQAGDRALRVVAQALGEQARAGDAVARVGGDELAVIAPETAAEAALVLAERLRIAVDDALSVVGLPLTVSVGVADLDMAGSVDDLVRFADDALYHAKANGRNQTVLYSAEAIRELSYQQALSGCVRAAAHAMNAAVAAKDGPAREHAEAVARVGAYIAARLGWDVGRRTRLREAALLHDVGKLAIPDTVLRKRGRLNAAERDQIRTHSMLGARFVEGLLDHEQRSWVRAHHERLDGRGYPDGLAGGQVPDGARILAVAEAYDAMTRPGFAARLRSPADAIAELRRGADSEFDGAAVDALSAWVSETAQSRPSPVA